MSSPDNDNLNLNGAVDNDVDSGVDHADILLAYTDAAVRRDDDLAARRAAVADTLGAPAAVDVAATVANYQRMVRIADGCGIPLDDFTRDRSAPWRDDLGINAFPSRQNTFS